MTEIAPETGRRGATRTSCVNDGHRPRQVPRGRPWRRHPPEARGQGRRRRGQARARSARSPRSTSRESEADVPPTAVKVRHILYCPKDDPQRRVGRRPSPPTIRPGTQAKADADAAYARLQADPSLFDAMARAESDESQRPGRDRQRRQAAGLHHRGQRLRPGVPGRGPRPEPARRADPRPVQDRLRLARRPGHVPPDRQGADGRAQDRGRRRRRLRDARPRQLRGRDRRPRRRPRLDRQGPARRRSRTRRSSRRRSASTSDVVDHRRRRAPTCSRCWPRRRARRRVASWSEIRSTAFGDWYQLKKDAVEITRDPAITGATG